MVKRIENSEPSEGKGHTDKNNFFSVEAMKVLFEMSTDLFCIVSDKGYFLELNPAWESLLGFTIGELKNRPFIEFVHPDDRIQTLREFAEELQGKDVFNFINRYQCKNGTYKFLEWKGGVSEGRKTAFAVARDITKRIELEEQIRDQESIYEAITSSANDAIIMLDYEGNITFWNKAATTMLGYSKEDVIGRNLHEMMVPSRFIGSHKKAFSAFQTSGTGTVVGKTQELGAILKDGSEIPIELSLSAIKIKDKWCSVAIIHDITNRKNLEDKNYQQYLILEQIHTAVITIDLNNIILSWNRYAETLYQYTSEEAIGKNIIDLLTPEEYKNAVIQNFEKLNRNGHWEGDFIVKRKDHSTIPVHITNCYLKDRDGNNIGFIGISNDITERKKSEELIIKKEQLYRAMFESHTSIKLLIDLEKGNLIDANLAAQNFYGYPLEQLRRMNLVDLNTLTDKKVISNLKEVVNGSFEYLELSHRLASGETRDVEIYPGSVEIDGRKLALGIIHDVTQRKKIEEAYRTSEARFHGAFDLPLIGIAITSIDKGWIEVNSALEEMIGYTKQELEILSWADLTHPDDLNADFELFDRVKTGEINSYSLEKRFIKKDGNIVWTIISVGSVRQQNGSLDYFVAMLQDITLRKEAEISTKREQILLRTLVNNLPDSIYVKDLDGKKILANIHDLEIMGVSSEDEILGKTDIEIFNDQSAQKGYYEDLEVYATQKPILNHETQFIDNSGENHWISVSKIPILDELSGTVGLVGICHDITEQKRAELKMVQLTEELKNINATKDRFFSIIAHDMRGPLISFNQTLDLITGNMNLDEQMKELLLEELKKSSKNIFNLLENLLNWSRIQRHTMSIEPVSLSLNNVLKENIDLLIPNAKQKNINILLKTEENITVFADHDSTSLVIRNLLSNAVKFTRNNGNITITVKDYTQHAEITIEDTGIGISKEILENLFKPFSFYSSFGTNGEKGSGLGLVLIKEFVERNGGKIRVESEPDKGSRFIFTLPEN